MQLTFDVGLLVLDLMMEWVDWEGHAKVKILALGCGMLVECTTHVVNCYARFRLPSRKDMLKHSLTIGKLNEFQNYKHTLTRTWGVVSEP